MVCPHCAASLPTRQRAKAFLLSRAACVVCRKDYWLDVRPARQRIWIVTVTACIVAGVLAWLTGNLRMAFLVAVGLIYVFGGAAAWAKVGLMPTAPYPAWVGNARMLGVSAVPLFAFLSAQGMLSSALPAGLFLLGLTALPIAAGVVLFIEESRRGVPW